MAAGMVSTPFPATGDAQSSMAESTSATRQDTQKHESASFAPLSSVSGGSFEHSALLAEVRKTVLDEVDAKMADKMKTLWTRGNKMLKKIESENQEQTAKFLEELTQRREKQASLKDEQEHLRTLLTNMVQQFSYLGAAYGGPDASALFGPKAATATPGASTPPTGACDSSSCSTAASATGPPGLTDSPSQMGVPTFPGGAFASLPAMPDFPFPIPGVDATHGGSIATPLSLMEALGPATASPASALSAMSPMAPLSVGDPECGNVFSFTLRKADGTDLGINVSHHEHDKVLRVEGVRPEGAVEAWNRQCIGSQANHKVVLAGDRIISVNGVVNEPAKMLLECRDKQLLKFTIMRGGSPMLQVPAATPVTPVSTPLRADACEFTPMNADAAEFVPGFALVTEPHAEEAEAPQEPPEL